MHCPFRAITWTHQQAPVAPWSRGVVHTWLPNHSCSTVGCSQKGIVDEAGFRTSKLAAPPSQIGGAPLAAPRGHLSGNGAGTHGGGKRKPSNAKKNATRQAAAAQARAERETALDFAQGAGQVDGVWYLDSKELKLALDRWERRNDSDASSLPQSLAQSLEPSERGSDDCPILSEDSFTGFSDCAEW